MKAIEQYLSVVLFIVTCLRWLTLFVCFESVDKILKCDHSNRVRDTGMYFSKHLFHVL